MGIPATNPTTIPAKPSRTYSAWWITGVSISAPDPLGAVNATITLAKMDPASGELSPLDTDRFSVPVANILSPDVQAKYPLLGPAVAGILAAVAQVGTTLNRL